MRGLLRLSMVWLLALLFAASGVAAHACFAAHHVAGVGGATQESGHHGHHAHAAVDDEPAEHHHGAADHHPVADHPHAADHGLQGDAACGKCCGSCTLVTGIMPSMIEQPLSVVAPARIGGPADPGSGSLIRVDPGIPKRIL